MNTRFLPWGANNGVWDVNKQITGKWGGIKSAEESSKAGTKHQWIFKWEGERSFGKASQNRADELVFKGS